MESFGKLRTSNSNKSSNKPSDKIYGEQGRTVDLHAHTYYSDGALSPAQLVEKAKSIGLAAVGVADHDTVDGLEEALAAGKKFNIEVIPSVEISCYPDPDTEFHILGYFLDWKDKSLQGALKKFQVEREERAQKLIKNLNNIGYLVDFGDLRSLARGTIAKPHIAWLIVNDKENRNRLLSDFGKTPSTGEFIGRHLVKGARAYEPRKEVAAKKIIDLIHAAGGLVILAHPGWDLARKKDSEIIFDDRYLEKLLKDGLDGLEVYAHRETEEDTRSCVGHYEKIARKKNLAISGGSDYHGFGSAGKELGFTDFYLKVPYKILEDLRLKARPKWQR